MSTKIRAVLHRKWEKTDKQGRSLIKAKGRDYYDLMWYLQKGIKPNLNCLPEVDSIDELREKLLEALNKLDKQSIKLDLEPLISDKVLINDLSGSIKKILKQQIEQF